MKKLAVLTAVVFLFGMGSAAVAETAPVVPSQVNGNDLVGGGGTNANDGGTAVAVKDNLNGNALLSNNTSTETNTETTNVNKPVTVTETKTGRRTSTSGRGGQSAANTGSTAVGLKNSANGNVLAFGKHQDRERQQGGRRVPAWHDERQDRGRKGWHGGEQRQHRRYSRSSRVNTRLLMPPVESATLHVPEESHVPGETVAITTTHREQRTDSNNKTNGANQQ